MGTGGHTTFRDWLGERVGDAPGLVSRRELGRRLAGQHPEEHVDPDSYRRTVRRILNGEVNPSQRTRDSIQDALRDWSAPRHDDEPREEDEPLSREEADQLQRLVARAFRQLAGSVV